MYSIKIFTFTCYISCDNSLKDSSEVDCTSFCYKYKSLLMPAFIFSSHSAERVCLAYDDKQQFLFCRKLLMNVLIPQQLFVRDRWFEMFQCWRKILHGEEDRGVLWIQTWGRGWLEVMSSRNRKIREPTAEGPYNLSDLCIYEADQKAE